MRTRRSWISAIVFAVAAPAALYAQTPLGTSFTYQGQLKQAGLPVTGDADMVFHLWDAETGGALYDSYPISSIPVVDGLFTVELDFGPDPFEGDARWLEIEVEFPSGAGNWTTLSPRQPVTVTPYAITAMYTIGVDGHSLDAADGSPINVVYVNPEGQVRLGGTGGAGPKTVNIHGGMDVFDDDGIGNSEGIRFTSNSYEFAELSGETPIWDYYQATDTHRFYTGDQTLRLMITSEGNIGIGTPSPGYPLHVESDSARTAYVRNTATGGTALQVSATGTGPGGYGLDAYASAPGARAIYAFNEAESGTAYAIYGENVSPDGVAIFGLADNSDPSSTGIGVYGRSDSDGGAGVYGEAPYLTGSAYGVRGVSDYGTGVQGEHQDTGNFGALGRHFEGVYGESAYGVSGIGVHGKWTGAYPGYGFGGAFTTTSHLAAGILGVNEATEPGGSGVIGVHEHTTGVGYGVRGETASSDGHGVHGYASATSGANRGVYGQTDSYDGHGGYFENTASGNYGALGGDDYGVQGRGDIAGGFFEDAGGSTYAYVGHSDLGIKAFGAGGGGYFEDISASGYAYVGYGDRGVHAEGSEFGGYFGDANGTGYAYVGYGNLGIEAKGLDAGGYFDDFLGTGYAYVGYGDRGIEAKGNDAGGYFEDTNDGGYAYVGRGAVGIEAKGSYMGGYFEDTDGSGYAQVAYGDYGIGAFGGEMGGWFGDADGSGYAYVGYGDTGIQAGGDGYAADFSGNVAVRSRSSGNLVIELGEGLDYAEGFDVSGGDEIGPGTVVVIDPASPGELTVSDGAYDTKVAGIVAGANGLGSGVRLGASGFDHDVALAGRVYCKVDATYGAVRPGDLLTTSPTPGYAMKVADHTRAQGAVLGKAMERLEEGEKGRILVLVTLQ